jgi:hypothetical protein
MVRNAELPDTRIKILYPIVGAVLIVLLVFAAITSHGAQIVSSATASTARPAPGAALGRTPAASAPSSTSTLRNEHGALIPVSSAAAAALQRYVAQHFEAAATSVTLVSEAASAITCDLAVATASGSSQYLLTVSAQSDAAWAVTAASPLANG